MLYQLVDMQQVPLKYQHTFTEADSVTSQKTVRTTPLTVL